MSWEGWWAGRRQIVKAGTLKAASESKRQKGTNGRKQDQIVYWRGFAGGEYNEL